MREVENVAGFQPLAPGSGLGVRAGEAVALGQINVEGVKIDGDERHVNRPPSLGKPCGAPKGSRKR